MAPKQTAAPCASNLLLEFSLLRNFPVMEKVSDSADGGFGLQFDADCLVM